MTLDEVAKIVLDEGLGNAVHSCILGDQIDNHIVREKWNQAKKLLDDIENILPDGLDVIDREYEEERQLKKQNDRKILENLLHCKHR